VGEQRAASRREHLANMNFPPLIGCCLHHRMFGLELNRLEIVFQLHRRHRHYLALTESF